MLGTRIEPTLLYVPFRYFRPYPLYCPSSANLHHTPYPESPSSTRHVARRDTGGLVLTGADRLGVRARALGRADGVLHDDAPAAGDTGPVVRGGEPALGRVAPVARPALAQGRRSSRPLRPHHLDQPLDGAPQRRARSQRRLFAPRPRYGTHGVSAPLRPLLDVLIVTRNARLFASCHATGEGEGWVEAALHPYPFSDTPGALQPLFLLHHHLPF